MMVKSIMFLFGLSLTSLCNSQNYYEMGRELYNQGNDDKKAIDLFTMAIESNQNVSEALLMRGATKLYLGDIHGAYRDIMKSETINPSDSDLYYYKGNALLAMDSLNSAMKSFNQAITLNKKDPMLYGARGMLYMKMNEYDNAIKYFDLAIKLDSNSGNYYNNRGYSYMMRNDLTKAKNDLEKAILLGDIVAIGNIGIMLAKLGKHDEALYYFDSGIKLIPESGDLKYHRAMSYIKLNRIGEACDDLSKSLILNYEPSRELLNQYCPK